MEAVKTHDPAVIEKAKRIDAREVFNALAELEQTMAATWLREPADQELFRHYRTVGLLKRLNRLEVTQEEFESVKGTLRDFNTDSLGRFVFRNAPKTLVLSRQWEKNIREALRFYEIAAARDGAISKTLDEHFLGDSVEGIGYRKNQKEHPGGGDSEITFPKNLSPKPYSLNPNTRTAVLVYGGFHKENIKRILEAKNISYMVVSPSITKPSLRHEAYYKRLMTQGYHEFELPFALRTATAPQSLIEMPLTLARAEVAAAYGAIRKGAPVETAERYFSQAHSQEAVRSEMRKEEKNLPAEQPAVAKVSQLPVYLYFGATIFSIVLLTGLFALTIDWQQSSTLYGLFLTVMTAIIFFGPAEMMVMAFSSFLLRLFKGPVQHARVPMPEGLPESHKTLLAYMLLSGEVKSSEEAFQNMLVSYMNNLDPNANVTAVLVSASNRLSIVKAEMDFRDRARQIIEATLLKEATMIRSSSHGDRWEPFKNNPRLALWKRLFEAWEKEGRQGNDLDEAIRAKAAQFASNFRYLHRTTRVLKKPGQYQDLFVLASRGVEIPYVYIDERYGEQRREPGLRAFGFREGKNIMNDLGADPADYQRSLDELEARGAEDIERLKADGATHGAADDRSFKYTALLDSDNKVPPAGIRELVEIAAANPDHGLFQPNVEPEEGTHTWFQWRMNLTHLWAKQLPEGFSRVFNHRTGFYGKALIVNDFYINTLIGTPENPIEALRIDIMSHDTIEGLYLNPMAVPTVHFVENPTRNYVARVWQFFRWCVGDIQNFETMVPSVQKVLGSMRSIYSKLTGNPSQEPFMRKVEQKHPWEARYVAHFSFRSLFTAPLFLAWFLLGSFGAIFGWGLVYRFPFLQLVGFLITLKMLVIMPKLYNPIIDFVRGVQAALNKDFPEAKDRMRSAGHRTLGSIVDSLTGPNCYMPENLIWPAVIFSALKSSIVGTQPWKKAHRDLEKEVQNLRFRTVLRYTGYVPATAILLLGANYVFDLRLHFLAIFFLLTWLIDPLVTWLGGREIGPAAQKTLLFRLAFEPGKRGNDGQKDPDLQAAGGFDISFSAASDSTPRSEMPLKLFSRTSQPVAEVGPRAEMRAEAIHYTVYTADGPSRAASVPRTQTTYADLDDFLSPEKQADLRSRIAAKRDALKINIIVPTIDSVDYIEPSLENYRDQIDIALRKNPGWQFEIVIALNGKNQEKALSKLQKIQNKWENLTSVRLTLLHIDDDVGKPMAMNAGAVYSRENRSDILGFIDDDIRYTEDSLRRVIEQLVDTPLVFLTGPEQGPLPEPQFSDDPFFRIGFFTHARFRLPFSAGQFMFPETYPMIEDGTINDDSYLTAYFAHKNGHSNPSARIGRNSGAFAYGKLTSDPRMYLRRFWRLAMGGNQFLKFLSSAEKSKHLNDRVDRQGKFNAARKILSGLTADQKVKAVFLMVYLYLARIAIMKAVGVVVFLRKITGRPLYDTHWYRAPNTKYFESSGPTEARKQQFIDPSSTDQLSAVALDKAVRSEMRAVKTPQQTPTGTRGPEFRKLRAAKRDLIKDEVDAGKILRLKEDVVVVVEQQWIDLMPLERFQELLELVWTNNSKHSYRWQVGDKPKLHLFVPDTDALHAGKRVRELAEAGEYGTVCYRYSELPRSNKIPVIGFSDMEQDPLPEFQRRLDLRLAERMKNSAFGLNQAGSFGVGILYALGDISRSELRQKNGYFYDAVGRWSSQVLEVLQAYTVISTSA